MTVTYFDLITLVLTSSLFAAGLTVVGNILLQRNNYKNDYYKKLLDKRIDAYENLEHTIGQLAQLTQMDDGRLSPLFCSMGRDYFDKFLIQLMAGSSKAIWLDSKTSHKLTELSIFLLQHIYNRVDEQGDWDEQLANLGALNRDKIKSFRLELENMLYKDLQTLHDVNKFINDTDTKLPSLPVLAKPTPLQKQTNSYTTTHTADTNTENQTLTSG